MTIDADDKRSATKARHAPLPRLCAECERALMDAVESRAADWYYCEHQGTVAMGVFSAAGAVMHWLLTGPKMTHAQALDQVKAAAMAVLAHTETGGSA